jgi:hypothetical protein
MSPFNPSMRNILIIDRQRRTTSSQPVITVFKMWGTQPDDGKRSVCSLITAIGSDHRCRAIKS